ncbi:hypothetical protein Dsin_025586 [Dipteronia sinensis]|uniref:Uncharacterized protein n=1 Tax=Dipteronia sinensis TaxID=43782 RepID=A0AAD9ZWB3_9ROSI|nr:hypothetical protein Dsin_025586 [Dipteronia sinensis]
MNLSSNKQNGCKKLLSKEREFWEKESDIYSVTDINNVPQCAPLVKATSPTSSSTCRQLESGKTPHDEKSKADDVAVDGEEWYKNLFGLNGIVYHPDGFLIVIHTMTGNLLKIDVANGEEVKLIELVVAGNPTPAARLVESSDGWSTASVVTKFKGPTHCIATVKDGKVYINHLVGMGYPKKKHAFVEAVF